MPAKPIIWTEVKGDYEKLFDTCKVHENRKSLADAKAKQIAVSQDRYEAIAKRVNSTMPWWFVGVIHLMECGLDFKKHLHNGDPLTARTKMVPAGHPKIGNPPFTFEDSAIDALKLTGMHKQVDWSLPRILYLLEGYNGYGYRQYHPEVKSPYLWSFTNHYTKGKYVADGKYDPNAVSQQLGIAAVIKRGFELKLFS